MAILKGSGKLQTAQKGSFSLGTPAPYQGCSEISREGTPVYNPEEKIVVVETQSTNQNSDLEVPKEEVEKQPVVKTKGLVLNKILLNKGSKDGQ